MIFPGADRDRYAGEGRISGFRENIDASCQIDVLVVEGSAFLDLHDAVPAEYEIGTAPEIPDGKPVICCKRRDLFLFRYRLIHAVVVIVVKGARIDVQDMPHAHHREVKDRKGTAGDQHSADEQVVDGLFSLEFHHTPRDDIAVWILPV